MGPTITISKPKLIVTEGSDDEQLIRLLLGRLELTDSVQIYKSLGKSRIGTELKALSLLANFGDLVSCVIIRDADDDYESAEKSVRAAFSNAGLVEPDEPEKLFTGNPNTGYFILPGRGLKGTVENLILEAVKDNEPFTCIDKFIECITELGIESDNWVKLRLGCYITAIPKSSIRGIFTAGEAGYLALDNALYKPLKDFLLQLKD